MRAARLAGVVAAGLLVMLAGVACGPVPVSVVTPTTDPGLSPSETPSPTPSPTPPPVDPAAVLEACSLASTATSGATKSFNDQIAALEQAAARNDQTTMITAAEAINKQFVDLGTTLTQLAQRPVSPELKTVLTDVAAALTQMSSLAYTGTTVDIRKKLLDFAAAFTRTCTPTSPSPTA
jgi:hypothetical protein